MSISWKNTDEALQDFVSILVCGKCGFKPETPVRLTNCGHFFCYDCISSVEKCVKCEIPVQPSEIKPDTLIMNLIQNCDIIAEVINKRDLWDIADKHSSTAENTISATIHTPKKQPYINTKRINKPNPKGETPLHVFCLKRETEKVKHHLLAGANPDTRDNAGWTPLQEMISYGYYEICELLLNCGASVNMAGYKNRKPLHEAVKNNRVEEIKLLLRYNADKNVFDEYGKKPIDYCKSEEIRQLLMDTPQSKPSKDLNQSLNKSIYARDNKIVVLASNLKHENQRLLGLVAAKHKLKILTTYRQNVTHVIVETNEQNIAKLTLDVLFALVHGNWLLSSQWIRLAEDTDDISDMDLELFEVSGAPTYGIPEKSRQNTMCGNPRLFYNCFFYFALQANTTYQIDDVRLTKDDLIRLVKEGDGTVLTREPHPEAIETRGIPFHIASDSSHPLHGCTHYVIYMPGKGEPVVKYNMPHIKTLPLIWLIECIEKFSFVSPADLGL